MPHAELPALQGEQRMPIRANGVAHSLMNQDMLQAGQLHLAEGIGNAFLHPAVAGDAGYPQQINPGRLCQHKQSDTVIKHFHHICIKNDLFFLPGSACVRRKQKNHACQIPGHQSFHPVRSHRHPP